MTTTETSTQSHSLLEALPRIVTTVVSLTALGYFVGWRESKSYYTSLGAPWAAQLLSPQALLQLSVGNLFVVVMAAFLSFQLILESQLSLRKIDWICGIALLIAAVCLFASQGQFSVISSSGAFALALLGSTLCAVAAGITLTQLHFTLKRAPGAKIEAGHFWLVYWFVLPGLFWAPDRLGQARALLDSDPVASSLAITRISQGANTGDEWRLVHIANDKALLLRRDLAGKNFFKMVEAKDLELIEQPKKKAAP